MGVGHELAVAPRANNGFRNVTNDVTKRVERLRELSWRRLFSYAWPYRVHLGIAGANLTVVSVLNLLLPLAVSRLLDAIARSNGSAYLSSIALGLIAILNCTIALSPTCEYTRMNICNDCRSPASTTGARANDQPYHK